MKIEIIEFNTSMDNKGNPHKTDLEHWSNKGTIFHKKMEGAQCIKYVEDYVNSNNMRILSVGFRGVHISFILVRE